MKFLMREIGMLSQNQWDQIDKAVVEQAKKILVGRRFLSVVGPLGGQVQTTPLDVMGAIPGAEADFWGSGDTEAINIASRRWLEIVTIYSDFLISWRDVESENGAGVQAAMDAAVTCAQKEDDLILYGDASRNIPGLTTASGINKIAIGDWNEGETPVLNVSKALEVLADKGHTGTRALIVSTDLYGKLHRIQPGTGVMEIERVRGMVDGKVFHCSRLEKNKALLVYCDPHNMDLVIGQDMITASMGNEKMDHAFRVMETVVPRVKRPSAIALIG